MNTFGLKKKGQSPFWLKGGFKQIVVQIWKDTIRFSVLIKRKLLNRVEF